MRKVLFEIAWIKLTVYFRSFYQSIIWEFTSGFSDPTDPLPVSRLGVLLAYSGKMGDGDGEKTKELADSTGIDIDFYESIRF